MINSRLNSPSTTHIRQRLTVTGVVQGVGFRPFVYGLAIAHDLTGFVGNDSGGVFIEVEGTATAVAHFHHALHNNPPPLAHIETINTETMPPNGDTTFIIVHSQAQASTNTLISPDICICDDCLQELFDLADRRYRYPFINCTNCGPRFTIIKDIPYDRPLTTMADFPMCPDCLVEYEDPLDRRFHAQPNACPVCGPHIWLEMKGHTFKINGDHVIAHVVGLLNDGLIVAVKGLGGFHLACDATNNRALKTLRQRKGRVDKPFAVMAVDLDSVRQFAHLSMQEEALLSSKERPIVLLRKKGNQTSLSKLVAPGNQYIGVMLPYTPLHYLLLHASESGLLVMTSGNYSNEPIVMDNDEARERLASLADAFLLHNRDINGRCDDSVVRVVDDTLLPIRRSRGYAPFPVKLPFDLPPTLAVGGELKATFCLANGEYGYMSQHIGDMENLETMAALATAVAHYQSIFRTKPELIACDMHPNYLSTQWAHKQGLPVVAVQHHHAHIAAVMVEHRLDGKTPIIGFSFDGTGYGTDGAIWGGEVLIADYKGFQRAAHLKYVPLAGGDVSVQRPYRLALSHLWAAGLDWDERLPCVVACPPQERTILRQQLEKAINSVPTSSMGRLFDAVAALIGVRQTITYEGQAAIELEALTTSATDKAYTFTINDDIVDPAPVIAAIVEDVLAEMATAVISAKFHNAVAHLILQLSLQIREETGLNQVALSGGVFQNVRLLSTAVDLLRANQFDIFTHRLVPPNDGGLALGQAIIARQQMMNDEQ